MIKFGNLRLFRNRPTIIAEVGVNHGCNNRNVYRLINDAKISGADAIKFQSYKTEKFVSMNSPAYWDTSKEKTKSQYDLFKKYDKFNFEDYKKFYHYCNKKKITFMTTLFDNESIFKFDKILKVFKISSSDITNVPLLKEIGKRKKHVLLSTGASNIEEIRFAIKKLNLPNHKICIMHCVLNYPTEDKNANLLYIKTLKKKFPKNIIGYSDHTSPDENLLSLHVAYSLGAQIIEKHFTFDKKIKGNDHYHSADKRDIKKYFNFQKKILTLKGNGSVSLNSQKKSIKNARRGIYALKKIEKGKKLTLSNIITLRPNDGICASNWDKILGKRVNKDILPYASLKKRFLY